MKLGFADHSSEGFKEYRLGNYSNWLQKKIDDPSYWAKAKSCIVDSKVCNELGKEFTYEIVFDAASLTPLEIGKAMVATYALIGLAWWWDETAPLGWWTLKPRTKEERDMAASYERRLFPYPGDKEAVKEFIEQGGASGTSIGTKSDGQNAGDDRVSELQKAKFDREAQKLWSRMQQEAMREFQEQGFEPVVAENAKL